ncbi:hypothetical protein AgCh_009664 [Apium graveolens]
MLKRGLRRLKWAKGEIELSVEFSGFSGCTLVDELLAQCEKEFHVSCLRDIGLCDLKELPKDKWFCCSDCNRIHLTMQSLVLKGIEIVPASVLDTVYKNHLGKGLTDGAANRM